MKTAYPTKKLGNLVLDITSGFACGKQNELSDGGIPHLRTHNIDTEGQLNFGKITRIPESFVNASALGLKSGDILFNNTNSTELVGKSALVTEDLPYAFSNHMTRIRVDTNKVIPEWIALLFQLFWRDKFFESICNRWVGQSGINQTALKNIEIPLPPVGEQGKIVERIEKQFKKIDEAARLRTENEGCTAALLPAALHEIFSSAASKGWEMKSISDACEKPQYGFTASSSREKVGPKLLRITDIQDGGVNWETVPYCKCGAIEKYRLAAGDLVFARTGATVGKSFLIQNVPDQAVFASYLIRLRAGKSILPEFLYYFFQSPDYWQQITDEQVGMAQPNVNGTKLAQIKIPLPPLAEQKAIVKKLDQLAAKTKHLQTLQSSQSANFRTLKQSILHQAFSASPSSHA